MDDSRPPDARPVRRVDVDPTWCLVVGDGEDRDRVIESLTCVANGVVGTRGVREEEQHPAIAPVVVAGLYEPAEGVGERLVQLPSWCALPLGPDLPRGRDVLDLRTGVLARQVLGDDGVLVDCVRFADAARPGVSVLRATVASSALVAPPASQPAVLRRTPSGGGVVAVETTDVHSAGDGDETTTVVDRVVVHQVEVCRPPSEALARARLAAAASAGPTRLLEEHRRVWSRRWEVADVEVDGDPEMTLAVRFALFHLFSTTSTRRAEAAVGARGLTGPAYAGHVLWDTEAFVLPVLAAVDPAGARAVLEYRLRRLGPAMARAAAEGRRGARFPWESAGDGTDVTPRSGIDQYGDEVPIRTGDLEEHVTADVAWAACRYVSWTGDDAFLAGPGRRLLVETARYWASRVRTDEAGRGHIDGVIGPDEYHEGVDDNAFTNLMARWNLRRAAELVAGVPHGADAGRSATSPTGLGGGARLADDGEAAAWARLAGSLVDGVDPATGRHEQFAGYDDLEPLLAGALGPVPVAADLVLGRERLARTQVIKQADVVMAHLLVPDEAGPASLVADLDHYLPRTAHGSSLSPSAHAYVLARAGRTAEALAMLRLAVAIDLEDLTETTASGLHLANLGGIWQAVVHGFGGVLPGGPGGDELVVDPHLPDGWDELRIGVRWRGVPVRLRLRPDGVQVTCRAPVVVAVAGRRRRIEPPGRWVG
jgi:trehalose/maltose hydrolase-like predicted phosphorylase